MFLHSLLTFYFIFIKNCSFLFFLSFFSLFCFAHQNSTIFLTSRSILIKGEENFTAGNRMSGVQNSQKLLLVKQKAIFIYMLIFGVYIGAFFIGESK